MANTNDVEEPEVIRLGKRLERERKIRHEVEAIAEKVTRELYEKQKELELLQFIAAAANEALSVEKAMQTALDKICSYTGWPVGHVYMVAEGFTGELIPTEIWHLEEPERFEIFRKVTENTRFTSGVGLPGRVLADEKPAWVIDVTRDSNFPRAKQAEDIGVKAGFAFPVLVKTEIVAVLEFFSEETMEPDERLLGIMTHIGTQLGRVVERKRGEEVLRKAHRELESHVQERTAELAEANKALQAEIKVRKWIEKKLRDSEENYRNLFENIPTGIYRTAPDGRILMANPALVEMLGYSSFSEMASHNLEEQGSAVNYSRSQFKEVLERDGEVRGLESAWMKYDGTMMYVRENARAVRGEGGVVLYYEGTVEDITERKRAEEALRESEGRFRTLVDNIPGAVQRCANDKDWTMYFLSDAIKDITGYPASDFIQNRVRTYASIIHSEDTERIDRLVQESVAAKRPYILEYRITHADGSVRWVHDQGQGIFGRGGELLWLDGVILDITERKRAEEALREGEEKYRTLIEHSFDFVCETDIHGRYLYLSPKYKDVLGYEPAELIGRSVFEQIHPDDCPAVMTEFVRAAKALSSGRAVFRFRHSNGDWCWFESTGKPYRTASGDVRGVIASRDVTERKQAEEKQTRLLRELESANQELKDFAYVVSHDLKAPLRAIASLASWISTDYADRLDEDGKEQMDLLVSRVKRMHNLIDGILQYSRVGRVREEKVEVDLNGLITEVIDMIAPPKSIEIKIENELPSILCEKTRIEQVFQNLLSNSVKFIDKPKGEIKIGSVEDGNCWKFSVADNGPGIEEKYFEKVFQIFQTLAPRDESESTGVGLALVKKVVDMYGGRVWVESELGCGSTFFFTLPK